MSFSFYRVNADYCDFLRKNDPCVPYTMDSKSIRPFVGIVFSVNGYNYYSPLTSPKPKHTRMKNQVDFFKINGGVWGAINFNNMIPVHSDSLQKVDMQILPTDTKADIDYKNLLTNQLSWCNANKVVLLSQAEKLYNIIIQGKGRAELVSRCCNFPVDEAQYKIYCEAHNLNIDMQKKNELTPAQTSTPARTLMKNRFTAAQAEADRRNSPHAAEQPQHGRDNERGNL